MVKLAPAFKGRPEAGILPPLTYSVTQGAVIVGVAEVTGSVFPGVERAGELAVPGTPPVELALAMSEDVPVTCLVTVESDSVVGVLGLVMGVTEVALRNGAEELERAGVLSTPLVVPVAVGEGTVVGRVAPTGQTVV
jgi:hypothetical protein